MLIGIVIAPIIVMKQLITTAFFLLINNSFAIDPTPGTGTYDPGLSCNHCEDRSHIPVLAADVDRAVYHVKDFDSYLTDGCSSKNTEFDFGYCDDGTISYVQPASEGMFKQEGLCGQTSISNMYHMYCHWNIGVNDVDEYYAYDYTPGLRTKVLTAGVNQLFSQNTDCPKGKFTPFYANDKKDFINSVASAVMQTAGENQVVRTKFKGRKVKRAPVAILLSVPSSKVLHWVTVVDVEFFNGQCQMILNQWGHQYTMPCEAVAELSNRVGQNYWGAGISSFTMIEFSRN